MNELKPEEVMKALELCNSFRDLHACDVCPYFRAELGDDESCTNRMAQDSLALHREKDAEIERLKAENVALENGLEISLHQQKQIEADTVRKMQERIERHATNGYPRKVRLDVIDQIAKELLEGV